jgi:autotransporter-associated beta strand protein
MMRSSFRFVVSTAALLFMSPMLHAALHVWNPAVTTGVWSVAANWSSGGVPTSGEASGTNLQFPGGVTATDDIAGLVVDQIELTAGSTTIAGVTTLTLAGSIVNDTGSNVVSANVALSPAQRIITVTAGTLTISGAISGSGGLLKQGAGTLQFSGSGANTYPSMTFVNGGTLELNKTAGVNAVASGITINAGTLRLLASDQIADNREVTVSSAGWFDLNGFSDAISDIVLQEGDIAPGARVTTGAGTLKLVLLIDEITVTLNGSGIYGASISGNLSLNPNSTPNIVDVSNGAAAVDLDISATIAGSGIQKDGGFGTLQLSGASPNLFSQSSAVVRGTMLLNKSAGVDAIPGALSIGGGSGTPTVRLLANEQINDSAAVNILNIGVLDLNSHNETINSLMGAGSVILSGGTLKIGTTAAATTFSGVISSTGNLVKSTGTLTLTGTNTWAGTATVTNGGVLIVDGSITAAPTTVSSGGTLAGTGSVAGISSAGQVSPGDNGPGTLLSNANVALQPGGTLSVELNGTAPGSQYDVLSVHGTVSLGGTLNVAVGFAPPAGTQFMIINNDSVDPVIGAFAGLPEGAMVFAGTQAFRITYAGGDGNDVVLTAIVPTNVPTLSPSMLLMLAALLSLIGVWMVSRR